MALTIDQKNWLKNPNVTMQLHHDTEDMSTYILDSKQERDSGPKYKKNKRNQNPNKIIVLFSVVGLKKTILGILFSPESSQLCDKLAGTS